MEDGNKTRLRSQVLRVFGQLLEGLGCGLEKDAVQDILISQNQRPQAFREGEHQVKIRCGEQILFSGFKPPLLIQALAFGAVAITAGVVGYPQRTAMVAFLHMTAEFGSTASLDGPHGPQVP